MRRGEIPVARRNRPPFDDSLVNVRDVKNKYHIFKIEVKAAEQKKRSLLQLPISP
jgi:hypothetical protein